MSEATGLTNVLIYNGWTSSNIVYTEHFLTWSSIVNTWIKQNRQTGDNVVTNKLVSAYFLIPVSGESDHSA